jgi:hypothetical protein
MKPKSHEFIFAKHIAEPSAPSEATSRALKEALGLPAVYTRKADPSKPAADTGPRRG